MAMYSMGYGSTAGMYCIYRFLYVGFGSLGLTLGNVVGDWWGCWVGLVML